MCSGFITCFEEASYDGHTFDEAISGGWLTRHNPDCTHYYGVDISILPEFRGRGLARLLYEARKNCCRKLNLKGIVINGIMPGFAKHKHALSAQAYIQHVIAGQIHDPTVSVQLRNGFSPIKLMANHFHDSATAGWAMLMEWRNPDYSPDLIKIKTPHRHRIREPHLV
jgi:GNAT superfamily N-acetyltransferase